jgi:hypothetical protein
MKATRIIHWTSTIIFAGFFLMSAGMYFTQNPELVKGMKAAGFPVFMLGILGTAKLLGAIALVQPKFRTLKEWAYAGFTINLIGAVWTHAATGTPFVSALVFLVILAVSYVSWKRLGSVAVSQAVYA